MIYRGTSFVENIIIGNEDNPNDVHFISISNNGNTFWVSYCCDPDWGYHFHMNNHADYERVKFNIMEAIFECEDTEELLDELSEKFEDGFADILIEDECDEDCENYDDYEYLN